MRFDSEKIINAIAHPVFACRRALLVVFALITMLLGYSATHLRVDAGFDKMIPLQHEYMQPFTHYQKVFGGANRVLVAVMQKQGDIYDNPVFLNTLKQVTDEVFFIPGVDRPTVTSLFTPNVRFIEVVEEGFAGGNVIPAGYKGTPEYLETVRKNVLKSGVVGRLVANDFRGALVRAELLELDPSSGKRLDYQAVAKRLEDIRSKYQHDGIDVHIIGFSKAVGDITDGARGVLVFFLLAFIITSVLLYFYSGSRKLTLLALVCALLPVVWLLGLLPLMGFGIDPMSILVPFLIFSIGVSHAVQMTNVWKHGTVLGADSLQASRNAFNKLLLPGSVALLANALGFLVIMHIKIDVVRELGITASLGVLLMIITNKMVLPILLSYTRLSAADLKRAHAGVSRFDFLWKRLAQFAQPRPAMAVLFVSAVLLGAGAWKARDMKTGDLGKGIPELHDNSRYNLDNAAIVDHFSIGVDGIVGSGADLQRTGRLHQLWDHGYDRPV
ncbi:MAG: MMPL family transporter [Gallionella sp.]|nr:MMPL family transporter [Gallionella sp.]